MPLSWGCPGSEWGDKEEDSDGEIVCDELGYTDDAVDDTRVCTEWCLPWTPLAVSIMGKGGW